MENIGAGKILLATFPMSKKLSFLQASKHNRAQHSIIVAPAILTFHKDVDTWVKPGMTVKRCFSLIAISRHCFDVATSFGSGYQPDEFLKHSVSTSRQMPSILHM
jgi:hypothetical protein